MKIALVGVSLFYQGAEFVLAALARGLAAQGHVVDVIVSKVHTDVELREPQRKVFSIGNAARLIVLHCRKARYSFIELFILFRRHKYDVIMCHASPYAIPVVVAGKLSGKAKTIYVEHLGGIGTDMNGNKVIPKTTFWKAVSNWICLLYDMIISVNKGARRALHEINHFPLDKISVVANPVIDEDFFIKLKQYPTHPWLTEWKGLPVIVAAGALNRVKHFDLLIRAFAKLNSKKPCRLVIFGEGPMRGYYEKVVRELNLETNVSLPGFSNRLPAEISKASCFVVSSFVESFSIVLVEAMACGVPVVAVDAPYGPREILKDGARGILVKNNDVEALADGILRALNTEINWDPMLIRDEYSVSNVSKLYEQLVNGIIKGKNKENK